MSTNLSTNQLAELFKARAKRQQAQSTEIQKRIQASFGQPGEPQQPAVTLIKEKVNEAVALLIAERLQTDDRSVPLILASDLANLVHMIVNEAYKVEPDFDDIGDEERQAFERFMQNSMQGICDSILGMVPHDKDPYDMENEWVANVLAIAEEQDLSPHEVALSQEGSDEINRRTYSKSQFVSLSKNTFGKIINPEAMKQTFLQPMLEALAAEIDDEEEIEEIRREMEERMEPELQMMCDKLNQVVNDWCAEETVRIYAV